MEEQPGKRRGRPPKFVVSVKTIAEVPTHSEVESGDRAIGGTGIEAQAERARSRQKHDALMKVILTGQSVVIRK